MLLSYCNFNKTSIKLVVKNIDTGILIASDKEVAPQVLEHPGARPTEKGW
jgi:hypothetical protein